MTHAESKDVLVQELDELLKDPGRYSSAPWINQAYELGYAAGQVMAHRLLRLRLGLSVPSDTEGL